LFKAVAVLIIRVEKLWRETLTPLDIELGVLAELD
jgi:hypothetical protein